MHLWDRLAAFLLRLIDQYDDQAIFILMFLEESGIPLPLPGDVYMILAGYQVSQGRMHILWALFLVQVATILGASLLYWVAARGGRPLLYRYGRFVRLEPSKLDRAEGWLKHRGTAAVFWGRIIPGLRTPTVIAAGVFGVPYWRFLLPFSVASFIYICFWVFLGFWFGPRAFDTLHGVRLSVRAATTAILFLVVCVSTVVIYRRAAPYRRIPGPPTPEVRRIENSLLAGFLATIQMALGVNLALYALQLLRVEGPERALMRLVTGAAAEYAGGNSIRFFAFLTVGLFAGGIAWAVLYAHVSPRFVFLPAWLRGLAFACLPLAVSLLVLMPLLGAGPFGFGLGAGFLPLAGELFRHALFGVGLGTSYSLLRLARQKPANAPADL
jgi:membrane-associated protein